MNRNKIKSMVDDLNDKLIRNIGDEIETLTIVGSYAFGKMSESHPDINLFLCLNEHADAMTYIKLSNVLAEIIKEYASSFVVRPDYRPFKFPYPFLKGKEEVFVNLIIVNIKDKDGDFPFGLPKHFLNGIKQARKVVYGNDILGKMDFDFDRDYLLMAGVLYLNIFKFQLLRAPISYDLDKDFHLVFNECLTNGKMIAYLGIEIALTDEEIKNKEYMNYIFNKENMVKFYEQKYNNKASKAVELILEGRKEYNVWKKDKDRAREMFTASYDLCNMIDEKIKTLLSERRTDQ